MNKKSRSTHEQTDGAAPYVPQSPKAWQEKATQSAKIAEAEYASETDNDGAAAAPALILSLDDADAESAGGREAGYNPYDTGEFIRKP